MERDFYDNGKKETWRGWAWNQIANRLGRSSLPISAGIYFPGPVDRDRQLAIKKGFSDANLFAVDIDESCVKSVRSNGGIAVCGNAVMVLSDLHKRMKVDFVLFDFLGGPNAEKLIAFDLSFYMCRASVFNFMRGRDGIDSVYLDEEGNEKIVSCKWAMKYYRDFNFIPYFDAKNIRGSIEKHRGYMAAIHLVAQFIFEGTLNGKYYSTDEEEYLLNYLLSSMKPSLYSYLSPSGMVYDSIAINCQAINPIPQDDRIKKNKAWKRVAGRNKAMLAVRTKKIGSN